MIDGENLVMKSIHPPYVVIRNTSVVVLVVAFQILVVGVQTLLVIRPGSHMEGCLVVASCCDSNMIRPDEVVLRRHLYGASRHLTPDSKLH